MPSHNSDSELAQEYATDDNSSHDVDKSKGGVVSNKTGVASM